MHQFTNNSSCKLGSSLASGATTFTATGAAALTFAPTVSGKFQMATLEDPLTPGVYEIVKVTARSGYDFTVERAQEGTTARSWPAGTSLRARVTAGMLGAFIQDVGATTGRIAGGTAIAGYPVMQSPQDDLGSLVPSSMTPEVFCATHSVELGPLPAWAPSTVYKHGDVVRPTTANGLQYRLKISDPSVASLVSPATQPSFGSTAVAFGDAGGYGTWIPSNPLNTPILLCIAPANVGIYLSEVGFICDLYDGPGGGSAPWVSIGTAADGAVVDATAIASSYQMQAINAAGYRFQFGSLPKTPVRGLSFKLAVTGPAGRTRGRFYFKGMLVERFL